ncbi:hypothetical protein NDU88_006837 [Pleurodeles waltl]|uniref:Uncharacterized protein n=1 Tax=Pleurodeles waltl TaxID=8319 RepID=A0AAV7TZP6_PLEWA|nr:hypothetical protein NDU88_006837 [Pleurodeles waltl]
MGLVPRRGEKLHFLRQAVSDGHGSGAQESRVPRRFLPRGAGMTAFSSRGKSSAQGGERWICEPAAWKPGAVCGCGQAQSWVTRARVISPGAQDCIQSSRKLYKQSGGMGLFAHCDSRLEKGHLSL